MCMHHKREKKKNESHWHNIHCATHLGTVHLKAFSRTRTGDLKGILMLENLKNVLTSELRNNLIACQWSTCLRGKALRSCGQWLVIEFAKTWRDKILINCDRHYCKMLWRLKGWLPAPSHSAAKTHGPAPVTWNTTTYRQHQLWYVCICLYWI